MVQISKQEREDHEQTEQSEEEKKDSNEKETNENNSSQEKNSDNEENQQNSSSNKKNDKNSSETNKEKLHEKEKTNKDKESANKSEESSESKEEWEKLLIKWINEADDEEISKEIKKELFRLIRQYRQLEKNGKKYMQLMQKYHNNTITSEEITELRSIANKFETFFSKPEIIRKLSIFIRFYEQNKSRNMDEITEQKEKFPKHLAQILQRVKSDIESLRNTNKAIKKNWKTFLRRNLERLENLSEKDKKNLLQLIEKTKISKADKKRIAVLLSKFNIEDLIKVFGESFKEHTENYIKWGWEYQRDVKMKIISDHLSTEDKKLKVPVDDLLANIYGHIAVGKIIYKILEDLGITYIYDPQIYSPKNQKHPDGLILINEKAKNLLIRIGKEFGINQQKLNQIKYLIIDFTRNVDKQNIVAKISKYNPNKNSLLIIIGLNWKNKQHIKNLPKDDLIYQKNYKNIHIISHHLWSKIIGIKNNSLWDQVIDKIQSKDLIGLKVIIKNPKLNYKLFDTDDLKKILGIEDLYEVFVNQYDKSLSGEIPANEKNLKKTTKNLSFFLKLIDKFGGTIASSQEVRQLAKQLLTKAYDNEIIKDKCKPEGYIGASLYLAAKYLNDVKTQKKVFKTVNVHENTLRRRLNDFEYFIEILQNAQLNMFFNKLNISSTLKDLTLKLLKIAKKIGLIKVYDNQKYFQAAVLYLASKSLNERISRMKIAEVFGIDRAYIKKAELNIGFINDQTQNNLYDKLINDYSVELNIKQDCKELVRRLIAIARIKLNLDNRFNINHKSYVLAAYYLVINHLSGKISQNELSKRITNEDLKVHKDSISNRIKDLNFLNPSLRNLFYNKLVAQYCEKLKFINSIELLVRKLISNARKKGIINDFDNSRRPEGYIAAAIYLINKILDIKISRKTISSVIEINRDLISIRTRELLPLTNQIRFIHYNKLLYKYLKRLDISEECKNLIRKLIKIGINNGFFTENSNTLVNLATAISLSSVFLNQKVDKVFLANIFKIDRTSILNTEKDLYPLRDFHERVLINKIFNTLNLSDDFKNKTIKLINKAKKLEIIKIHKDFRGYIVAAIYLVGRHLKIKLSQPYLAKKLKISRWTIYDRLKEMRSLETFLDENLESTSD